MMTMSKKILIADDEENIRFTYSKFLQDAGYSVFTAANLADCIKALQGLTFDALFLDLNLGTDNSLEAIETLKKIQPDCPIVMITGELNPTYIARAQRCGARDYLVKPVYKASLLYILRKALEEIPTDQLPRG